MKSGNIPDGSRSSSVAMIPVAPAEAVSAPEKFSTIDWDFTDAKTTGLTHGIHPYPAGFIPQIPNALIQELSRPGDMVGDIFCGSGTTLVESLVLKRHAVGIDGNPLACLIARVKTSGCPDSDRKTLLVLAQRAGNMGNDLLSSFAGGGRFSLPKFVSHHWRPPLPRLGFWFDQHAIKELAEVLAWCREVKSDIARDLALTAFSSSLSRVRIRIPGTSGGRRTFGRGRRCGVFHRGGPAFSLPDCAGEHPGRASWDAPLGAAWTSCPGRN